MQEFTLSLTNQKHNFSLNKDMYHPSPLTDTHFPNYTYKTKTLIEKAPKPNQNPSTKST